MTRRYAPRIIPASHSGTQAAEQRREAENPAPPRPLRSEPSAWEAKPEPEAVPVPRHGRPPRGLQPPAPTRKSPALGMFDEALRRTSDPQVKRRLRSAQREMSAQIAREIEDLPPGADPSAYGY